MFSCAQVLEPETLLVRRGHHGTETGRHVRLGRPGLAHVRAGDGQHGQERHRLAGLQGRARGRAQAAVRRVPRRRRPQPQDAGRRAAHTHHMPRAVHHRQLHVQVRVAVLEMNLVSPVSRPDQLARVNRIVL